MSDKNTPERDAELDRLLPWYVNGSLSDDERARVEVYLAASADAREEVELLGRLRDHVKADQPAQSPGELGLLRLQRKIAADRKAAPARAGRFGDWWRPAAVAAALVIAIQSALLFQSWRDGGGVDTAGDGRLGGGAVIEATFAPEATEAQIRAVLQAIDGRLIDGPGALGVYRIQLPGVGAADGDAIREAIAALRARPDVVTGANEGQ